MGNGNSVPDNTPLKSVFQSWSRVSSKPMKKKKMLYLCNTVWPKYQLESGEKWPQNGSLNYNTILQLDSFCKRQKKWEEIQYVESFMTLYKRRNWYKEINENTITMGQSQDSQKKSLLPESKSNDGLVPSSPAVAVARRSAPPSAPGPSAPPPVARPSAPRPSPPPSVAPPSAPRPSAPPPVARPSAHGPSTPRPSPPPSVAPSSVAPPSVPPPSPPLVIAPSSTPLVVPSTCEAGLPAGSAKASTGLPQAVGPALYSPLADGQEGTVSLLCPHQGTQFGPANTLPQAKQFLLRQVPAGLDDQCQSRARGVMHHGLSAIDLFNYKAKMPSYQDDPRKMERLFKGIFAVYHPNWAAIQVLMNSLLSPEEHSMVLEKALQEAERLREIHPESPIRTSAEQALPRTEPGWDPSDPEDQARLDHYKDCLMIGLQKGANNFRRVQNVRQGQEECPYTFLERLHEAFRKYTDIDPEHPNNMGLVNLTFISQSAPDIRRKLQQLEEGPWLPTSQLLEVALEVFRGLLKIREKQEQCILRKAALLSLDHSRPSRTSARKNKWPLVRPQGPPRPNWKGHPFVGPQQCAFCKQEGHWKRECPKNRRGPLSSKTTSINGVFGEVAQKPFLQQLECHVEKTSIKYNFMYEFECHSPLAGQEVLTNLNDRVGFSAEKVDTRVLPGQVFTLQAAPLQLGDKTPSDVPEEILQKIRADVWADGTPGRAKTADPVVVKLRPGAQVPNLKQPPLKREVKEAIKPMINTFLKYQLIQPCQSPYNTPILPVKKPGTGEYLFVQNLRAINQIVEDIHSVMPNPDLSGDFSWFTVLNLKDAFYCIPLSPESQKVFAFEWEDPETNIKQQYCWTVLPLGFKNATTIFVEAFLKDLKDLQLNEGILLQYVGNILIASKTKEASDQNTVRTLNFLADRGYKVSKEKVQISQPTVKYLGVELSKGQRNLLPDRREAIAGVNVPTTKKQLKRFLGKAEFCRIWIPNFGLIVKPLYEALKRSVNEPLNWTAECLESFHTIKEKISTAPALGLPDIRKPFDLFVHERQGVSLGVLTQNLDTARRPVAYLSKQLDIVSQGWPVCFRAVAATCDLLREAEKFTEGSPTSVHTPHRVQPLLERKGRYLLTSKRLGKYRAILFDKPNVTLKEVSALNPATLLPSATEEPVHDCIQITEEQYPRPDLTDQFSEMILERGDERGFYVDF